jgi:hypothetical protein
VAATYLGTQSIGGCVVGLNAAFAQVGTALAALNNSVTVLNAALSVQNDSILAAKDAIRIPSIAIPQVQAGASADINLGLEADLADPALYLSDLLAGLSTVQASLEASIPTVQLEETIAANLSFGLDFSAQIAAIDLQLSALVTINAAIGGVISALAAAVAAVSAAIAAYASMSASLAVPGAYAFVYTGPLNSLGSALDAITPSTGLPGATNVLAPVMLVQQLDTSAVNAVNSVYRTS